MAVPVFYWMRTLAPMDGRRRSLAGCAPVGAGGASVLLDASAPRLFGASDLMIPRRLGGDSVL